MAPIRVEILFGLCLLVVEVDVQINSIPVSLIFFCGVARCITGAGGLATGAPGTTGGGGHSQYHH